MNYYAVILSIIVPLIVLQIITFARHFPPSKPNFLCQQDFIHQKSYVRDKRNAHDDLTVSKNETIVDENDEIIELLNRIRPQNYSEVFESVFPRG